MGNYEIFINIGKYVDKIDKNITQTISAQKEYSNLLSNLRKDIEEFSWKNKSEGKRHSQCKECRRKADNKRYAEDPNRKEAVKAVHKN